MRSHTTPTSPSIGQALIGNITLESTGWHPMGSNGFVDLNWPGLPIGWVGCCTLGFTFAHGSIKPNVQQALVNLPYLHSSWTRSVFQWYEYTAAAAKSLQSDSMRPHRRQPTRRPCPWDSPGKNIGVGCHFLLQCCHGQKQIPVCSLP